MDKTKIDFSPGSPARKIISEEFKDPKWNLFRTWFFDNFTNQEKLYFQEEFYKTCEKENSLIPFVSWFINTYVTSYISVLERNYNLQNGKIYKGLYPPQQAFHIEKNEKIHNFLPFAKLLENDTLPVTCKHINTMFEQQNYTNLFLNVLGEQIQSIHNRIEMIIKAINNIQPAVIKTVPEEKIVNSSIQPPPNVTDFKLRPVIELEKILEDKFNNLSLKTLDKKLERKLLDNPNHSEVFQDQINKLGKWAEKPIQNRFYYRRPTPMDVLHEEYSDTIDTSYSSNRIYEWNIDGLPNKQIYNTVHRMLMYSTICKSGNNNDKTIANMIVAGFTGQLKGWWDNYLSPEYKESILNTVKKEGDRVIENAVYTLVLNIIEHFTGRFSDNSETIRTLLQNQRCKTLGDFRWYKDTFLSRVMELPECNSPHWKSKFIDGLPGLFAERVRKTLRQNYVTIPYESYTYGYLIDTCIQEGLALCNEIKLNQQIKRQSLIERRQLGDFCEQFGLDNPTPKDNYKRKKPFKKGKHKKHSQKHLEKRNKRKEERIQRKENYKRNKFKICKTCGKFGHTSKTCWTKKKINNLDISEDLKSNLMKIMLNSESEKSESESYDSYSESEEEVLNALENEDISESESECEPCMMGQPCIKQDSNTDFENKVDEKEFYKILSQFSDMKINVLTSNNILELLKTIKDPSLRTRIIEEINMDNMNPSSDKEEEIQEKIDSPRGPYTMSEVMKQLKSKYQNKGENTTLNDLVKEIDNLKVEIKFLKNKTDIQEIRISNLENDSNKIDIPESSKSMENTTFNENFLSSLEMVISQKWYINISLLIDDHYSKPYTALVDSGADLNVIQEGLIPTRYFHKTTHTLWHAGGDKLQIQYKLPKAFICIDNKCIPQSFILAKNISNQVILGTPFLQSIYPIKKVDKNGITGTFKEKDIFLEFIIEPFQKVLHNVYDNIKAKQNQINFLKQEINIINIDEQLKNPKLQNKIELLKNQISLEICNDHPNAFWDRKKHIVSLPYEDSFDEKNIPTKARPCQMNSEYLELCKKEIDSLLQKGLIRPSQSAWSCTAFYVNKHSEIERGVPRLVINYKPLNKVLKWIRHPIPNKKDLLDRLYDSIIFSKFDLKSGYWQIQINESDRYKTAFNVPIGHYEWNVMPFGLKNAPSEFQKIMNEIFTPYSDFIIVYIDDILVFSKTIEMHFKHLQMFKTLIIQNGLVISKPKMELFQTKIRFLGHIIEKGKIIPINRSIDFADKFPDEITDKTQLQRFLGSLNYIAPYYKDLIQDTAILYDRLKKNPKPWTPHHTETVKRIKSKVKTLPCLMLSNPNWEKIVETDASEIGFGGILTQVNPETKQVFLVRFHSGKWNDTQKNYATIAKEILAIVKCILKFQDDLYNQKFTIITDCYAAKFMFQKDFKHDVSKQMFARWQAHLAPFDFEIVYKKGEENNLPDFLTREYLK